jgi:hypothetical protein
LCQQECEGDKEPCERGLGCRLEVFGESSGSVDPAEYPFDEPALGRYDGAFEQLVVALDDGDGDTACLERGALRFVAIVACIDETHCHERALATHIAQDAPRRVSILRAGRRDLTFDRQAERVDGDMPFATFDFSTEGCAIGADPGPRSCASAMKIVN